MAPSISMEIFFNENNLLGLRFGETDLAHAHQIYHGRFSASGFGASDMAQPNLEFNLALDLISNKL